MNTRFEQVAATLLALFAAALAVQGQVTLTILSQSDNLQAAPLQDLNAAAIRGGRIAHAATTGSGNNQHHSVIWMDGAVGVRGGRYNSGLPLGDAAPGIPGAPGILSTFSSFYQDEIFVNSAGGIAFKAYTVASSNFGFWAGTPGSLKLVARHGDPAPGTNGNFSIGSPGNTFGALRAFNDAGQVAFKAKVQDAPVGSQDGVWAGTPGAVQLVARAGSPAPGFANGVTWNHVGDIQLNSAGQVAVYGRVTQRPSADSLLTDGYVLMAGYPGALQFVAKAGDPAPDAEPYTYLRLSDSAYALNSAGQVAYLSDIWSGKSGIIASSKGILVGSAGGGSRLVARTNYRAPGTDADAVFQGFDEPALNNYGEVAFAADVKSAALPSSQGIWTGKPGRLRKLALTNDVAPGTGGQLFGGFIDKGVVLSDSGQVAFLATYSPGGGIFGSGATTGLFATDKTGVLHLVARGNAAIGGGPVLSNPRLTGGSGGSGGEGSADSKRSSFDQQGRLVFYADGWWRNPATGNDQRQQFIYRATFPEAAPVILPTDQPVAVRAVLGGSAVFEVNALGSRPAAFQWRLNGQDIPGATFATLTLNSLTPADRGTYTVVVTKGLDSTTSAPASLTFPPVLTNQPQDLQINAGTTGTLAVTADGPGTFSYLWQFKATATPDFTTVSDGPVPSLTLPNITPAQAGRYRVIVTNSDGSTTSREAVVTVAAAGAPLVKRLLIPGDPMTGISEQLGFGDAEDPVINNAGEIIFEGREGTEVTGFTRAIYLRSAGGQYRPVMGSGSTMIVSDSGVMGQVSGTSLWQGPPGDNRILASRNAQAPDGAGSYTLDSGFALADDGTTAFGFGTHLSPTATFMGKPGAVRVLARRNAPAPGLADGVVFLDSSGPVISPSGTAAFIATLSGTGITADNNTGLWKSTPTGVMRIVAEDDLIPGAGSGVRVGEIRYPESGKLPFGWNEAGQVALSTSLAGPGITTLNDNAILAGTPGALVVAARDGLMDGHTFDLSRRTYANINRSGQVAFVANVTPTGTTGVLESLWRWTPGPGGGSRQLIAREGQQAPGLAAGIVMDSDLIGRPVFGFAQNAAGQLVLTTRLAGPGISFDDGNDLALYITTPAGELKFIARTGGMIDLGGGELRELGYMTLATGSGGEDGRERCFTEGGEVVFMGALKKAGSFALDYGLFTARLAPDPTAFTVAYSAWVATAFPAGSGPEVTGPAADPDKDGMLNAMEYLMSSNPLRAAGPPFGLQSLQQGIRFSFPRRPGVPEGFETIESTTAPAGRWDPVGRTAVTRTGNGAGQPDTVTVELPGGEDQRFVRVRVAW